MSHVEVTTVRLTFPDGLEVDYDLWTDGSYRGPCPGCYERARRRGDEVEVALHGARPISLSSRAHVDDSGRVHVEGPVIFCAGCFEGGIYGNSFTRRKR